MAKATRTCLIEERKRRQWSQQELADRLGTTRNNISRWELGLTTPGAYFRAKLGEIFGKQPEELGLFGEPTSKASHLTPAFALQSTSPFVIDQHTQLWHVPYPRNPFLPVGKIFCNTYTRCSDRSPVCLLLLLLRLHQTGSTPLLLIGANPPSCSFL